MTKSELLEKIKENDFDVTFSGGDPLLQIDNLIVLAAEIKKIGKNIWCYTGYNYDDIVSSPRLSRILDYVDVIVDGRYEADKRDTQLLFRGSANQRLIDVAEWRTTRQIKLWESDF